MGTDTTDALEIAAALCRQFEGFVPEPYLCPAGYWTQGWGTVYKPDGSRVQETDPPISQEQADEWLMKELQNNYMPGVLRASPLLINRPGALGAMTDFAYNLGVPRYRASTLRKRIEAEDWDGARQELARWVYAGGRILRGLVRRRAAEAEFVQ